VRQRSYALLAALCLTLLGAAPPAKPAQAPMRFPKATVVDLGGLQLVRETEDDAKLAGLQVFFSAGLDRETIDQNGVAALTAESLLRTLVDGSAVRDAIAARGGSIDYTIDGRETRYYLEAPAETMPEVVGLFARAIGAPDFSAPTVAVSRAALTARINDTEGNALSVAVQMFRRSYYGGGAGLPSLGTASSLAALTAKDAARFFAANYRSSGMSASAVGRVTPALTDAVRALASAAPGGATSKAVNKANPIPANAPRIVARRDVGAPIVIVGYGAPSPGSADFGPMLVLESLLATSFERVSATSLGVVQRSIGASYLYDGTPASLVVYINGNRVDPTVAMSELLLVAKTLASKPMNAASLRGFKTAAEGTFVTDNVTLSDRSYLLGTLTAQGRGPDAVNAALVSIERTTPADVQRVAKRYLQRYIVALIVPRSASEGT